MGFHLTTVDERVWAADQAELHKLRERVSELESELIEVDELRIMWRTRARTNGFTDRPAELEAERDSLREEVERLKAELAWVTETELGLTKQNQKLNRAKLQAAYDALAEHCQTAKHPSPLLLAELQSMYRLLEDPA